MSSLVIVGLAMLALLVLAGIAVLVAAAAERMAREAGGRDWWRGGPS